MKKKRMIALLTIATSVIALSGIGAATYAGYYRQANVGKDVGVQRYLFLDVSNWIDGGQDFYIYLFTLDPEHGKTIYNDPATKQWYKATQYSGNVYWFYVPTAYDHALFVRSKSGAPLADIQAWVKDNDHIRSQTDDIALGSAYNAYRPDGRSVQTYQSGTMALGSSPVFN